METKPAADISKPLLNGTNILAKDELQDLQKDDKLMYWRWDTYKGHFPHYCQIAQEFRCNGDFSAQAHIGRVNEDWNPLGFAVREVKTDPCQPSPKSYCDIKDWQDAKSKFKSNFGARVFLIKNMPLASIADAVLIDFGKPGEQIVPDIGIRVRRDSWP